MRDDGAQFSALLRYSEQNIMASTTDLDLFSHHACCLVGGDAVKAELIALLEKRYKIRSRGNPDLFDRTYLTFTVDDARAIRSLAATKPVSDSASSAGGGKKIFILRMNGITVEAQNALLKSLEEPGEAVHFFLIVPSAHLLIPTVKSRLAVIEISHTSKIKSQKAGPSSKQGDVQDMASSFLKMPVAKRLDLIKSFMDEISKEKRPKQDALDLLDALEESIHAGGVKKNPQALEAIETARTYMNDRSPSLKMLLEYVAMSL